MSNAQSPMGQNRKNHLIVTGTRRKAPLKKWYRVTAPKGRSWCFSAVLYHTPVIQSGSFFPQRLVSSASFSPYFHMMALIPISLRKWKYLEKNFQKFPMSFYLPTAPTLCDPHLIAFPSTILYHAHSMLSLQASSVFLQPTRPIFLPQSFCTCCFLCLKLFLQTSEELVLSHH